MADLEYVVVGYVATAVALGLYVLRLRMRARDATRRVGSIVAKRDR